MTQLNIYISYRLTLIAIAATEQEHNNNKEPVLNFYRLPILGGAPNIEPVIIDADNQPLAFHAQTVSSANILKLPYYFNGSSAVRHQTDIETVGSMLIEYLLEKSIVKPKVIASMQSPCESRAMNTQLNKNNHQSESE